MSSARGHAERSSVAHTTSSSKILLLALGFLVILNSVRVRASEIEGIVVDPEGRVTEGARILLSDHTTIKAITFTDENGHFSLANLDPGQYELRVALSGFRADTIAFKLAAEELLEIRIQLRISAIAESIVVSASHVDLPLSRVSDSIDIINAADLKARQIETISDALRMVAGLTVTSTGGRGGITSLFPRGGESNFTLVLIDGVRVNTFGGDYNFAHLPVADIERIEIVRGPQSALYGSDAIGAVIHIVTRHGGPPRSEATIETGNFGTNRLSVASSGSTGLWSWGAMAEQLETEGYTGTTSSTGERVTNNDYLRQDLSLSGSWSPNRGTKIRGNFRLGSNEGGFPGPFGSDPAGNFTTVDRITRGGDDTHLFSVAIRNRWTSAVRQDTQLTQSVLGTEFNGPFGQSVAETSRFSVRTQTTIDVRKNLGISLGAELQEERIRSTFITVNTLDPIPIQRRLMGYFSELRIDAAERLFITSGLRLEHTHRHHLDGNPAAFPARPTFNAESGFVINPKISVGYFLQPVTKRSHGWTRLRLSAGTGIRPPTGFEIAFTDNPKLKSERGRSVDLGIEQAFLGGALMIQSTVFFNRYDDLIVAVGRSFRNASQFRTDNIANALARGIEVSAVTRINTSLETRANYTWLITEVLAVDGTEEQAPSPFEVGDPLIRRPRHQGNIDILLTRGRFQGYARFSGRGHVLDVEPSLGAFGGLFKAPGYFTMSIGANLRMWSKFELFGRITNMLNRQYEETLGFPALGRSAIVGVRVATR